MKWVIVILLLVVVVFAGCTAEESTSSSTTQSTQQTQTTQQQEQTQESEPPVNQEEQTTQQVPLTETQEGITLSELSKHNTKTDCWIGYKGQVYDITDWLPRHPGSSRAIEPYCGTASEFEKALSSQHGTKQDARLDKEGTLIGELI